MKNKFTIPVVVITIIILAACSSQSESEKDPQEEKDKEVIQEDVENEPEEDPEKDPDPSESEEPPITFDAPPIPQDITSIISYPSGKFSGEFYTERQSVIEEELDKWPSISDEDNNDVIDTYWAQLVSLFAEDYPDPENLIETWKQQDFGNPEIDDPRYAFKENYNVEIILDASGSMNAVIDGRSMMEWAKEAIQQFASSLPEEANVGLRVYGHKGTGSQSDKQLSCESSELMYELQPYDKEKLTAALEQVKPSGWTPIAESLLLAKEDLAEFDGENNTNIIFLVSDGVETCDGDPVKVAEELAESSITPLINVIGFNVDSAGQQQLREVAEAANGSYSTVRNMEQLQAEFDRSQEIANKWLQWKIDADTENIHTVQDRELSIFDYKNEWAEKSSLEIRNLDEAILYLYATDKITTDQRSTLRSMRSERYDLLMKAEDQTYNDLLSLVHESYKEMERQINEKYKEGT